jgi:hypothetical protein
MGTSLLISLTLSTGSSTTLTPGDGDLHGPWDWVVDQVVVPGWGLGDGVEEVLDGLGVPGTGTSTILSTGTSTTLSTSDVHSDFSDDVDLAVLDDLLDDLVGDLDDLVDHGDWDSRRLCRRVCRPR